LHLSSRPVNRIGVAEYGTEEEEEAAAAEGRDGELGEIQKENAPFIFSSASFESKEGTWCMRQVDRQPDGQRGNDGVLGIQ